MVAPIQIKRTATVNGTPATLLQGELAIEMSNPLRLWVGTPTGNKTLVDTSIGYVLKTGDTMAGPLIINFGAHLGLNKTAPGQTCFIQSMLNNLPRWQIQLGDATPEGGGNAGSNFAIPRFANDGTWLDVPLTIERATGITLLNQLQVFGSIGISRPITQLSLDKTDTAAGSNNVTGFSNTLARWNVALGSSEPETGSNAGSNFAIGRSDDLGNFIDEPLTINRATGAVTLNPAQSTEFKASAGGYPKIWWVATGNAADLKKWQSYCVGTGDLRIAAINDAENAESGGITIERATGALMLSADPTQPMHAATKQYADIVVITLRQALDEAILRIEALEARLTVTPTR